MEKEFINPRNLFAPTGYSHVVTVEGAGKLVYVSGQVARDGQGRVIAGDLAAQTRLALHNLVTALAAAGATPADVVKINTYVVNLQPEDRAKILALRNEVFTGNRLPASTLIGVAALVEETMLVEIEAVAALH